MQRKRFVRRGAPRPFRPSLTWAGVNEQWSHLGVTVTTSVALMSMQEPATLVGVTSDPAEDISILRIVGDFQVTLTRDSWTLGLIVCDIGTTFTTFLADSDRRVLWHQTYEPDAAWLGEAGYVETRWGTPGHLTVVATANRSWEAPERAVHLDISPRVRLEPGKQLALVAWENAGTGAMTTTSRDMRVLFRRSGRR